MSHHFLGPFCMQGQGHVLLYNCFLFSSHSISSSSFVLTSVVFSITGETHNAFLELSNAISNVFHRSQCYSCHETTLGSLKMAINSLAEPIVSILFLFLLLDLLFLTVFLIVTLFRSTQFWSCCYWKTQLYQNLGQNKMVLRDLPQGPWPFIHLFPHL